MPQDFLIRPMQLNDLLKIVDRFTFPWSTREKTEQQWKTYYLEQQNGVRTVAVIEKNDNIIGYGSLLRKAECPFFLQSGIPEVNAVWIDENFRRQGHGKALIQWIENLARKEGFKEIGIGVGLYRDYGPAQRLYYKLGYIPNAQGITYKGSPAIPGQTYCVDDDLLLWLLKSL